MQRSIKNIVLSVKTRKKTVKTCKNRDFIYLDLQEYQ